MHSRNRKKKGGAICWWDTQPFIVCCLGSLVTAIGLSVITDKRETVTAHDTFQISRYFIAQLSFFCVKYSTMVKEMLKSKFNENFEIKPLSSSFHICAWLIPLKPNPKKSLSTIGLELSACESCVRLSFELKMGMLSSHVLYGINTWGQLTITNGKIGFRINFPVTFNAEFRA